MVFRTAGMSQEDKDFEDRRDFIIYAFKAGDFSKAAAFKKLKGMGLSDNVAYEDLNG